MKKTIRTFFVDEELVHTTKIEMKPWGLNKNALSNKEFIEAKLKNQYGLIKNPSAKQLKEIIYNRSRNKGKTVYFRDLIKKFDNSNEIIEAEVLKKQVVKVKVLNE